MNLETDTKTISETFNPSNLTVKTSPSISKTETEKFKN